MNTGAPCGVVINGKFLSAAPTAVHRVAYELTRALGELPHQQNISIAVPPGARLAWPAPHLPIRAVGHLHGIAGHPPRAAGFGAHRHDDVIGLTFLHQAGPHADAVLDDHAEAGALGELVADDVAELGSVGHAGGEAHLAAGLRLLLAHRHLMADASSGDCRL